MKKLIILAAALIVGTTLPSCKKEYLCKCAKTYTHADGSTETEPDGSYTYKDSSPRAIDRCNANETTGSDFLKGKWTRDCEIQ